MRLLLSFHHFLFHIHRDIVNTLKGACLIHPCLFHKKTRYKIIRSAAGIRQEIDTKGFKTSINCYIMKRKGTNPVQVAPTPGILSFLLFFPYKWTTVALFLWEDAKWMIHISERNLNHTLKPNIL